MTARPTMLDIIDRIARLVATRSTCSARATVGAVLFDDKNRIIATGYNGAPRGLPHCDDLGCDLDADGHCKNAIHAEVNAILQCAVIGRSTEGLQMFCTHSPCIRCANIIIQAGITRIVYATPYRADFESTKARFAQAGVSMVRYKNGFEEDT